MIYQRFCSSSISNWTVTSGNLISCPCKSCNNSFKQQEETNSSGFKNVFEKAVSNSVFFFFSFFKVIRFST